ncbi:hypothetical protein CMI37_25030 [Candidatus Pacearchaeota archaeon]|nr:hypothetical protein [Candidatus Pacearchaeota archaeon]|tara:strand:- start:4205 stop:5323 length:1119 start_codon:yes stop_codon:yes gene_type:complete
MPETDIDSAIATDVKNTIVDYSVDSISTDAAGSQKETSWQSHNWSKNLGYYKTIPELKVAIDTKANWTIGAGFQAEEATTLHLGTIKGNGKDTFNSIIKNMIRIKTIDGDSYAEIIRDKEGVLLNLKPLSPDSVKSVQNMKGRFIRYEQINKIRGQKSRKFQPDEILHLSRERIADEIHGISVIPSVENIILMRNEAMADWKRVMHRNVDPLFIFHLDTDDAGEIAKFKATHDGARKNGENLYVPKGVVEPELVATAANASLNPLTWINQLNDYFFQAVNVPQIIIGNAKEFTDASGKIVYLAFEQSVKGEQLYIEEQILAQLGIEIRLTFPASLETDAISDRPSEVDLVEEEPIEEATQPNDTTQEIEGKT